MYGIDGAVDFGGAIAGVEGAKGGASSARAATAERAGLYARRQDLISSFLATTLKLARATAQTQGSESVFDKATAGGHD